MNIISITTNTKEKKLIIELEDNLTTEYTDKESFIIDFPEMEAHWNALEESIKNSILTPEQELQIKLNEANYLLASTEFKFNADYDLKDTPEWLELKAKRQEAREFIRANNG